MKELLPSDVVDVNWRRLEMLQFEVNCNNESVNDLNVIVVDEGVEAEC